jgi:dihydrodipicolinate synthase/N-acetylneuraminate lyase
MNWTGVIPAITTPFREDLSIDHDFLAKHAKWMIDSGCTGIVALGSLGEGATLEFDEKLAVLQTLVRALRAPLAAAISALSTDAAVRLAKKAEEIGCSGLMVLPPYVYSTDWREMKAHVSAVIRATKLSCMLYNNPIAYRTDFLPEQVAELAEEHDNLLAVKESAADIRRVTSLRSLLGNRLEICVGVDDLIVEGIAAGAAGWIAGLVNALPKESVALFNGADIYPWFLPLLRLDTVPKFVQLIKLVQAEVGMGSERVRPPRLALEGEERAEALKLIRGALKSRPRL